MTFEPGPLVTMYSCGITPYDSAHLGHAAVYLYFDMLQRRLQDLGHETRCVRNVTDVDDDILRKSRELGRPLPRPGRRGDGPLRRRDGMLDLLPVYSRAAGDLGHRRDPFARRGGAHRATPTRRAGPSTSTWPLSPLRSAQPRAPGDAPTGGRERWQPRRPQQAEPAGLRVVAAVAARRAGLGVTVGSGPAGLAHRVLGAGPARARGDDRHPRRGTRPRLPPP